MAPRTPSSESDDEEGSDRGEERDRNATQSTTKSQRAERFSRSFGEAWEEYASRSRFIRATDACSVITPLAPPLTGVHVACICFSRNALGVFEMRASRSQAVLSLDGDSSS